jgi:hypothetical protein
MTMLPLSPLYRNAVWFALALQVPLAAILLALLDGGQMARIGGIAMMGFWMGAAVLMVWRPLQPTPLDLLYIRVGYPLVLLVGVACAAIMDAVRL